MGYYYANILITLLALIAFMVALLFDNSMKKHIRLRLVLCDGLTMTAAVCECIVNTYSGTMGNYGILLLTAKTVELLVAPLIPLQLFATMFELKRSRVILPMALINTAVLTASLFSGFIFYFDSSNTLCYGSLYWIFIGIYTISMLVLFVGSIVMSRTYQNRNLPLVIAVLMFALIGFSIHLAFKVLYTDWIVVTIGLILMFFYYRSLYIQVDELSGLLDRRNYTVYKSRIKKNVIFIIFDIDNFKDVNDDYGHIVGDKCIMDISESIKKVYHRYGLCFRLGGDEFCVVMNRGLDKLEALNNEFEQDFEKKCIAELGSQIGVSIGYGEYRVGENTISEAVETADNMMYKNKRIRKLRVSSERVITDELINSGLNDVANRSCILVVEDNEINREILDSILSPHYDVLQAENGKKGLEILEKGDHKIALILLDIQMPVMNGYEFLDIVGKSPDYRNIPIIVTTASDSPNDEIKCLENGAIDFVTKPYNPNIVLRRVESILRFREASYIISKVEHDNVTGFYNKEFFYMQVERLLSKQSETEYDLVCLCVNSLRMTGERFGKRRRDEMLSKLADSIGMSYPDALCFGRIRSNIFAFICKHQDKDYYEYGAKTIRSIIKQSSMQNITISIGLYKKIDKTLTASTIFENALLSIDQNKYQFEGQIAEFDEFFKNKLLRQHVLSDKMEESLEQKHYIVNYQAKHRFASDKTEGAEALIRWIHPELGFVSPGEFIPLFESNGFVTRLDYYVVEQVCTDINEWRKKGVPVVPISLNLSRADFEDVDLVNKLQEIVSRHGVPNSLIHFEVTESAYIDNIDKVLEDISKLHKAGFRIELDDFGTGYSSLSMLNNMSIDILKLDMSLVRNLDSENQLMLLKYILAIANSFGLETVAEGVETDYQAEKLKEMGCTYAQGYYYSKPVSKADFEEYLRSHAGV